MKVIWDIKDIKCNNNSLKKVGKFSFWIAKFSSHKKIQENFMNRIHKGQKFTRLLKTSSGIGMSQKLKWWYAKNINLPTATHRAETRTWTWTKREIF
jgi:hypothetical protein